MDLTKKEVELLWFYWLYRKLSGICPTYDEAARVMGISRVSVWDCLNRLERKGAVTRDKHKQRSVVIASRISRRFRLVEPRPPTDSPRGGSGAPASSSRSTTGPSGRGTS